MKTIITIFMLLSISSYGQVWPTKDCKDTPYVSSRHSDTIRHTGPCAVTMMTIRIEAPVSQQMSGQAVIYTASPGWAKPSQLAATKAGDILPWIIWRGEKYWLCPMCDRYGNAMHMADLVEAQAIKEEKADVFTLTNYGASYRILNPIDQSIGYEKWPDGNIAAPLDYIQKHP